jgi:L-fuconolactonase
MPYKIIDTHIHIWNFDKAEYPWLDGNTSILNRTYTIDEIEEERINAGIVEGVLVQASNNFEDTDWMLENAANVDWITGVVGWLPLQDPEATNKGLTEKYLPNKYFKGVRHLIHDEPDADWLLQPTVIESLQILAEHNLTYDVVGVLPKHIEVALKVAEKVPSLKMIFDHLNQPPVKAKEKFGVWGDLMKQASQHKNFYAKISGLGTTSGKQINEVHDELLPYIEYILNLVGTERCFCGGDWPVSLLAGSYTDIWNCYKNILPQLLNEEECDKIFYANAKQFYNL